MATGKKQSLFTSPGMAHFAIYTGCILCALWLSGIKSQSLPFYLAVGAIVFVSHWLTDATTVVDAWMHSYRQSDLPWLRVVLDQIFHILVLAIIVQVVS